jgi:hypothetical protein
MKGLVIEKEIKDDPDIDYMTIIVVPEMDNLSICFVREGLDVALDYDYDATFHELLGEIDVPDKYITKAMEILKAQEEYDAMAEDLYKLIPESMIQR